MTATSVAIAKINSDMARMDAAIGKAMKLVEQGIKEMEDKPLAAFTVRAMRKAQQDVNERWERIKDTHHTLTFGVFDDGPDRLKKAATMFSDDIQAKISAQAPKFSAAGGSVAYLRADDGHWKGPAAEAYRRNINPQNKAITDFAATADETSKILVEAASTIRTYYITVAAATGEALAAIILSAAGGPIGILVGLIAALVILVGQFTYAHITATNSMNEIASKLRSQANNNAAFPDGGWPSPQQSITTGMNW